MKVSCRGRKHLRTSFSLGIAEVLIGFPALLFSGSLTFSEPSDGFKVFVERGKADAMVTAVF